MGTTETKPLPVDDDGTFIQIHNGGEKTAAEVEVTEEDLEEVTCVICQEEFDLELRQPKMLDCHHTFCLSCLSCLEVLLTIVVHILQHYNSFCCFCFRNFQEELFVLTNVRDPHDWMDDQLSN